jgi:hypothetical protein
MRTYNKLMKTPDHFERTSVIILAGLLLTILGCSKPPPPPPAEPPGKNASGSANFDAVLVGALPLGWVAGVTGTGSPMWTVEADSTASSRPNVLKQSGQGTFCWCVKKDVSFSEGFVEVKFKPISGTEDQAGGLVWRWKDGDNYYVARANALENNVAIYHTMQGKRTSFKTVNARVATNQWHTLRVDFKGKEFVVTFNGKALIQVEDGSISGTGAIGVWTKADSVTVFDDFAFAGK